MNFLFTCGGTAGHINPALAVAGILRDRMPDCGILFVGANGKMETDLVPRAGYDIVTIEVTNIHRSLKPSEIAYNFRSLHNARQATKDARKIIEDFKPDVAIGTGGYVCYPVLKAAAQLGIPTVVHESNAVPGLTTKMLAGAVDRILVGFEESKQHYSEQEKVVVTGTPVRGAFTACSKAEAKRQLGLDPDRPLSHDEQLTEDDIKDRTLSDFAGAWKSLHPYLLNGDLDKFCQHRAEEDEDSSTTKDTYLEKYKTSWQCDAEKISISGNTITFTYGDGKTVSAEYTYAGYQPKRNDEGEIRSVRYQFETTSADAPKYVQFNDHGHEPGEAEHFHIYFGNDGFDALMSAKTNPFFVKDTLSVEDILDELMGHDHGEEADEHVWLSLKNAKTLVGAISNALQEFDPDNKDTYATNAAAYIEKLSALDGAYQSAVDGAAHKTVLFGDRFPFRYLVDDYGLRYYAAFAGCSAETEASFETVSFLAKKVDELGLPCVLTIEGAQHRIAETIVQNTAGKKQKVLTMDSMQSTTSKDVANGATYLSVMEKNLSVLKEALG